MVCIALNDLFRCDYGNFALVCNAQGSGRWVGRCSSRDEVGKKTLK